MQITVSRKLCFLFLCLDVIILIALFMLTKTVLKAVMS